MEFQYGNSVKLVFGKGKLQELAEHAEPLGSRALLVTTGISRRKEQTVDAIKKLLHERGIQTTVYADVTPNPKRSEVNRGAEICKKAACDFVIALGGGSSIDAAKAIALSAGHERDVWDFASGCNNDAIDPQGKTLPIVAITTTSGTGSHVTPYSVITHDETNEKPGIGHSELYPTVSIVDPELMVGMPKAITAATGFDVLAHAIEAYTSRDASPITDLYCEKAIKLVVKNLPIACSDTRDVTSREALALADTLSGYAIANAMITLCHSMAHAIGGVSHTVHGETLSAVTPHTVRFSMLHDPVKYQRIGQWISGELNKEITLEESVQKIEAFINEIGLPTSLESQGVKACELEQIARDTVGYMKGGVALDPRVASYDDVLDLLKLAF